MIGIDFKCANLSTSVTAKCEIEFDFAKCEIEFGFLLNLKLKVCECEMWTIKEEYTLHAYSRLPGMFCGKGEKREV